MWDPHKITGGNPADPARGDPLGYLRNIPYHMGPVWFPNKFYRNSGAVRGPKPPHPLASM